MNIVFYKLLLLACMIVITLVAGLVPIKLIKLLKSRKNQADSQRHQTLFVSLLSCFSGGVFLASCFLHLLPEANESYKLTFGEGSYPVVELLSCVGFFLVYAGEEFMIALWPQMGHAHGGHDHYAAVGQNEDTTLATSLTKSDSMGFGTMQHTPDCRAKQANSLEGNEESSDRHRTSSMIYRGQSCCKGERLPLLQVAEPERCEMTSADDMESMPMAAPHEHSHGTRSITFVLALALHSVIEGIAFGVIPNAQSATVLFITVMIHKSIVAFSVGVQLTRTHAHQLRWVLAAITLLALMTPLGAILGIALQETSYLESYTQEVIVMVAESIAVGTFLYVTFFEVLINERNNASGSSLLKMFAVMVGFTCIAIVRIFDEHEHAPTNHGFSNMTQHLNDSHEH